VGGKGKKRRCSAVSKTVNSRRFKSGVKTLGLKAKRKHTPETETKKKDFFITLDKISCVGFVRGKLYEVLKRKSDTRGGRGESS